jgi:hypothetical protein
VSGRIFAGNSRVAGGNRSDHDVIAATCRLDDGRWSDASRAKNSNFD